MSDLVADCDRLTGLLSQIIGGGQVYLQLERLLARRSLYCYGSVMRIAVAVAEAWSQLAQDSQLISAVDRMTASARGSTVRSILQ